MELAPLIMGDFKGYVFFLKIYIMIHSKDAPSLLSKPVACAIRKSANIKGTAVDSANIKNIESCAEHSKEVLCNV